MAFGEEVMTVPKKEQNAGVALLLERMKTNPEEFTEQGKWVRVMQDIHKYGEPEESKAINDALKALMMQKVTETVLEELVDPKSEMNPYEAPTSGIPSAGTTLGGYLGAGARVTSAVNNTNAVTGTISANPYTNTLTIGNQTLDQKTIEHIKAHLEYIQKQKQKEHKTLFGRLFNYS
jgi:hypothetical protein